MFNCFTYVLFPLQIRLIVPSSCIPSLPYILRLAAYLTMVQAIERAGAVDREKVRAALTSGTFQAPPGDIVFDERGFPKTNGAFTVQLQGGKVVVVWPAETATGKVIWPAPTWQ